MINYNIARNAEKNIIRHDWELDGYTLSIIKDEDGDNRITTKSPLDAPTLYVDDFCETPVVAVNWSSSGDVNSSEAREYAAKIIAAADIADTFQNIIDGMK